MDPYEGFREFVRLRQPALMRTAYLLTGNSPQAEDLLQTVLMRTARHWRKLAADANPEAYVRRALYNEHVSWYRRTRGRVETPRSDPLEAGPGRDPSDESLHRLALHEALMRLTRRQRAVLVLRFYEDRSVEETADLLGCSAGTVKSQTSHALGRLRVLAPELAYLLHDVEPQEAVR
ncbi:SigE family RNA polymerase sigma factor [Nonomuraea sp. NPDC050022]|uniref:SigE family RNA polymerase sigma factor n=1 Tax=unclassified Nonomuraea TaxID=2593643 RepID=UPI0033DCB6F0